MESTSLALLLLLSLCLFSPCFSILPPNKTRGDEAKLLYNGNFEMAPLKLKSGKIVGRSSLPGWRTKGLVQYISAGDKQGDMLLIVPHHGHAVRLGNEGSITQRIRVKIGKSYALTFSTARTCAQSEALNISVTPLFGEVSIQTIYSSDGWDTYSWAFEAMAEFVHVNIVNHGHNDHPACGPLIDGIAINMLNVPRPSPHNLVKNGGFEAGPRTFHTGHTGVLVPPAMADKMSPLPGWVVELTKPVKYVDARHFKVPQGRRAVELIAGRESILAQYVRTEKGKTYDLSFVVGDAGNNCVGPMSVEVAAGRNVMSVPYVSKGLGGSLPGRLRFKAAGPITRVAFSSGNYHMKGDSSGSMCGPVIDQVLLFPF